MSSKPKMSLLVNTVATVKSPPKNNSVISVNNDPRAKFFPEMSAGLVRENQQRKVSSNSRKPSTKESNTSFNNFKERGNKHRLTSHDRLNLQVRNENNKGDSLCDIMLNQSLGQDPKNTSNINLGTSMLNYSTNKNTSPTVGGGRLSTKSLVYGEQQSARFGKPFQEQAAPSDDKRGSGLTPSLGLGLNTGNVQVKTLFAVSKGSEKNLLNRSSISKNDSPFYRSNQNKRTTLNEKENIINDFKRKDIMVESSNMGLDNILNDANNYLDRLKLEEAKDGKDDKDDKLFSKTSLYSVQNYFDPKQSDKKLLSLFQLDKEKPLNQQENTNLSNLCSPTVSAPNTKNPNRNENRKFTDKSERSEKSQREKVQQRDSDKNQVFTDKSIIDKIIEKVNERNERNEARKKTIRSERSEKEIEDILQYDNNNFSKTNTNNNLTKNLGITNNVIAEEPDSYARSPKDKRIVNQRISERVATGKSTYSNFETDKLNKIEKLLMQIEGFQTKKQDTRRISTANDTNPNFYSAKNFDEDDYCNIDDDLEENTKVNKIYEKKTKKNNIMAIITDDLVEYNIDEEDYNDFIENFIAPAGVVNVEPLKTTNDSSIGQKSLNSLSKGNMFDTKSFKRKSLEQGSDKVQDNCLKELKKEFESLKNTMTDKENIYRETIYQLLKELKSVKEGKRKKSTSNALGDKGYTEVDSEDSFYKGMQDSSFQSENTNFRKNSNDSPSPNRDRTPVQKQMSVKSSKPVASVINNQIAARQEEKEKVEKAEKVDKNNCSFVNELNNFKNEDMNIYKTDIPLKYQTDRLKLLKEEKRNDGKVTKYYENSVIEVITRNGNITKHFPDRYVLNYYNNKDIKQTFPDGRTIYYYMKNKSYEFYFPQQRMTAFKFSNNQLEKHFDDGRKYIKFTDGLVKIIRPNGEELNEFKDKRIQKKDKFGNITMMN